MNDARDRDTVSCKQLFHSRPNQRRSCDFSPLALALAVCLQQQELQQGREETSTTDKRRKSRNLNGIGGARFGGSGAACAGRLCSCPSRLGKTTRADVFAFDDRLAILIGLEARAVELTRGLKVESTRDESQSGEFDAI